MSERLVTIGMPVYQGAAYIEDAVRSLLEQTERDLVVLISDDGSTDETPAICARLATEDPRVRFVRQEPHLGMTGNFLSVLREARSEFFLWAAQDDRWDPAFLAETIGMLRADGDALGAMTAIRFVDDKDEPMRTVRLPRELADPDPVRRAAAVRREGYHAIYALFRLEALRATGVPLEAVPAPDVAFVFGLALHGRILTTDRELSTRRVLGYARVIAPDGRVVWEKALGADGKLYDWSRAELRTAMLRHVRAARVTVLARVRLRAIVWRVWLWGTHRNLVEQTGSVPVRRAWRERRYVRASALAMTNAVLRPRRAFAELRGRWLARRG